MNIYTFKEEDARRFASENGFRARRKDDELIFKECPYCHSTSINDKEKFSINLKTGQFHCWRASCGAKGNMLTLAKDFNFSLGGLTGFDLHGKTVGVIGTGKIGRIFIDICRGFGMRVIAYDRFPAEGSGIEYVSLDELFDQSEIISLHCPLTEETRHLINAEAIEKMKKGAVILNTSRGGLIDAEALLAGIRARKVGAACLDVYEEEADVFFEDRSGHILDDELLSRLISMPNVIVTSHQAFLTEEALENIADTTIANILSYYEKDGLLDNELCYRCGNIEKCKKARKERCF